MNKYYIEKLKILLYLNALTYFDLDLHYILIYLLYLFSVSFILTLILKS